MSCPISNAELLDLSANASSSLAPLGAFAVAVDISCTSGEECPPPEDGIEICTGTMSCCCCCCCC